jgi:hypothetical protein
VPTGDEICLSAKATSQPHLRSRHPAGLEDISVGPTEGIFKEARYEEIIPLPSWEMSCSVWAVLIKFLLSLQFSGSKSEIGFGAFVFCSEHEDKTSKTITSTINI